MTPKCSEPSCEGTAYAICPQETDEVLCEGHYQRALDSDLFCYRIGEQICTACKGRSFYGHVKCTVCHNTGAVEAAEAQAGDDEHWQTCSSCRGLGRRRRRKGVPYGSVRGSYRRRSHDAPRALAA